VMGRIHAEAERVYFATRPKHRDLVRPLLNGFDITFATRWTQGNDEVGAMFLKPLRPIRELLGLEREMLMVYSPFPQFQARALELHDALARIERVRLDPLGSIVVSDDPNVHAFVQEILRRDPERPPIVALSSVELSAIKSLDDLRRVLVEQFFRRDLFAYESPIRHDDMLFGRGQLVTDLVDRFRNGQNAGLFGLRRVGKTSVLYALGRRCNEGELGGFVYVDLNNPSYYKGRWTTSLQNLVRAVASEVDPDGTRRTRIKALNRTYSEEEAARHFTNDLNELRAHLPGRRLLLALDEVHNLTPDASPVAHWQDDALHFWATLRQLHQISQGEFCYVLAGVNPRITELVRLGNSDNPLFDTLNTYWIEPFDRSTVREMVRRLARYMGLRCEESLYGDLHERYGGHPFLIRKACSRLARAISERPAELTTDLMASKANVINRSLVKSVRQIVDVLASWYPEEYELLRVLAQGRDAEFAVALNHNDDAVDHLVGYGLIGEATGSWRIRIGIVADYLRTQVEPSSIVPSESDDPDVIQAEVSRRRNAIEPRLRALTRDGLSFEFGPKSMEKAVGCIAPDRKAILMNLSYERLWDELYFWELRLILDRCWDAFAKRMAPTDRQTLLRWLDHVNKWRRVDAHASSIDRESLAYLRIAFHELEVLLGLTSRTP
jgi:hypothetical protein